MAFLWIMTFFLFLYIVRAARGPSVWDRLLGMNLISTKIVLIIILFASVQKTAYILDFAIIYALFGFIGVIFISIFLSEHSKRGHK